MNARFGVLLLASACAPASTVALGESSSSGTTPDPTAPDSADSSTESTAASTGVELPPDVGGPPPEPSAPARLVVDVATDGGHAIDLYTWTTADAPTVLHLVPESASSATFTVTPLGAADRVAIAVGYGDGHHEAFLVDWSLGSVTIESLLEATSILAVFHVPSLDAIVVRHDNDFTRFDLGGDAPGVPIPLLEDLPFGVVFEDDNPVMPHLPVLALRGTTVYEELYIGDIADPSVPTLRVTDFVDTPSYPGRPQQLVGGHLVFPVYSHVFDPTGLAVVPRQDDAWGALIDVPSPADPVDALNLVTISPIDDSFVYFASLPDPALGDARLGRVDGGELALPTILDTGTGGQHTFAADGSRLAFVDGEVHTVEVIDFDDTGPSPPRQVVGASDVGDARIIAEAVAPDGSSGFARLLAQDAFVTHAVIRYSLARPHVEVVAGDLTGAVEIIDVAVAPDARSLAFTATSDLGFVTSMVDCSGPIAGPATMVADLDSPIAYGLRPSPDGAWLAVEGSTGGGNPSEVLIVHRDTPQSAVLDVGGLRGPSVWLP